MAAFGFDIDGTISAAPDVYRMIMRALVDAGHQVHVITGTGDGEATPDKYERRTAQLAEWRLRKGWEWTHLHIVCRPDCGQKKAVYCAEQGIQMMFEDSPDYADPINHAGTLCVLMPRQDVQG